MEKTKIKEMLKNMKENEVLNFGRIKVKKILSFTEANYGTDNLKYRFYKWQVEQGVESDEDYDMLNYSCHNDEEINNCIKTILTGELCY